MITYILDGIQCNPDKKEEIEFNFDFTDRRPRTLEISVDTLTFKLTDFTRIKAWRATYGRFVGMPLDIKFSNFTTEKYYLDFQDPALNITNTSISVKIVKYQGTDNFFDRANGLSFGSINWDASDFVEVDYVQIPEDQFIYFLTTSAATFTVGREVINAAKEVSETATDIIKAATPVGLIPGPDYGAIIILGIKLTFRIAYLTLVVIAMIKLIVAIVEIVFQPIRQFKATTVKKLVEKACSHLGFTLSSSLLGGLGPLTILPVPLKEKDPSWFKALFAPASLAYTNGYPSTRDSVFLFGQLIDQIELIFNARTVVKNGLVQIERVEYFKQNASGSIPEAFNLQEEINESVQYNSDEIFKRLIATYEVDPMDMNTFDDTSKSVYEVSSEVINSPDTNLNLIKNVDVIQIDFARGTIKGELTFLENAVKNLAKVADLFTGGNATAKINARKNVMQVGSQYFGKTKLLWMNGTKLDVNQKAYIGADVIVNKYHSDRFIQNNQKEVFNQMPVALNEGEVFNILSNNYVNLNGSKIIEIVSLNWSEKRALALVDYTVSSSGVNEKTIVVNAG